MKSLLLSLLVASLSLASHASSATETPHGSLLELHSCELYAGGCTISSEATQGGRYMLRVWDFAGGEFSGTSFKGLRVAALQASPDNLAATDSKSGESVVYLPKAATQTQRDAILSWLKTSQSDFKPEQIHTRVEPLELTRTAEGYSFSAGDRIKVETRPLAKCDAGSCGEDLWYEPRTSTSVFTVAVNRSSTVVEPLLKLTWTDSARRTVFLGRFGEPGPSRDVFVTMNEFCGATGLF